MSGDQQALNNAEATPTLAPVEYGDGLVSTVEFSNVSPAQPDTTSPDGGAKPADQTPAAGAQPAAPDNSDASPTGDQTGGRLDRDSRFQQVLKNNKHLKKQLDDLTTKHNEVLERLDKMANPQGSQTGGADDGKVFGMTQEELLDLQATNPGKYTQLLIENATKQVTESVLKSVNDSRNKRSFEESVGKTYEQYAKENPDFDEMWDAGDIQDYIDKHPGYDAISAHMALTQEARINAAVEKAVKEATDKIYRDLRTKGKAAVLGAGPSGHVTRQGAADQELQNSKAYGGKYAVLARRSAARLSGGY